MTRRLVADIGGTNARLALAENGRLCAGTRTDFKVKDHAGLEACLDLFAHRDYASAMIAVAGPPVNNRIGFTNSPWVIDGDALSRQTGKAFVLINDFTAQAYGANALQKDDCYPLGHPRIGKTCSDTGNQRAPLVVLGPGTGLGVAGGISTGDKKTQNGFTAISGEGGHVGFSPRSPYQAEVFAALSTIKGLERLSAERILCGQGLVDLHAAVTQVETGAAQALDALDGRDITAKAASAPDSPERRTFDLFLDVLGNVAGDFALSFGAKRGVFLSGFLSGKQAGVFLPLLNAGTFRRAFEAKGRLAHFNAGIPVYLMRRDDTGLCGAALYGRSFMGSPL